MLWSGYALGWLFGWLVPFCLFTCMPEYVIGEMLLATKALAADFATKRRLVGVGAHMVG